MSDQNCSNPEIGKLLNQYEFNQLSETDNNMFEDHLMECVFCLREINEMLPITSVMQENRKEIVKSLHKKGISYNSLRKELLAEKVVPISAQIFEKLNGLIDYLMRPIVYAPATALAVVVFLLLIIYPSDNPYLNHLDTNKLLYEGRLRQENREDSLFHEAMGNYQIDQFKISADLLKIVVEENSASWKYHLYLGISYYMDKQPELAINSLIQADSLSQYSMKFEIRWYLAQSYLLNNRPNEAKPLLQWLAKTPNPYSDPVKKLLEIIDKNP